MYSVFIQKRKTTGVRQDEARRVDPRDDYRETVGDLIPITYCEEVLRWRKTIYRSPRCETIEGGPNTLDVRALGVRDGWIGTGKFEGGPLYFTNPYSSWQRGSKENTNVLSASFSQKEKKSLRR